MSTLPPSDEPEPEPGDLFEDITRELGRLFPADRMQRIIARLEIEPSEENVQFLIDLISATFTRGIEFGAVEVTAQQIEAGEQLNPQIEITHVDLP
ncbi:MAG: hypothetical protein QOF69_2822 [Solirubrobacteraceae bacterium]|jgi:hypothetical protein|nr:hypothetical protein [Solirubrobacteraceae bacterium]